MLAESDDALDDLQRSEELFRSLAEHALDPIVCAGTDGRISFFNRAAERIFGRSAADALGQPLTILMPARYRTAHLAGLDRFVAGGETSAIGRVLAIEGIRADGTEFPIEVAGSVIDLGDERVVTAVMRDLTERDATDRALEELSAAQERQRLIDRMMDAVESERRSIAAELRDGPIQHLAALAMRLHMTASTIADDPSATVARLAELEKALGVEIGELRALLTDLVPTALQEHGLVPALRDLGDPDLIGPAIELDIAPVPRLTVASESALYRIAKEALGNATRHAEADHVTLVLSEAGDRVILEIRDDGCGFSVEGVLHDGGHFGLTIMRERAQLVGGRFEVRSSPGEGTTVNASVPRRLG